MLQWCGRSSNNPLITDEWNSRNTSCLNSKPMRFTTPGLVDSHKDMGVLAVSSTSSLIEGTGTAAEPETEATGRELPVVMLSLSSSNRVSNSEGTLVVDSVSADIKPFATKELKRLAIGFKLLLVSVVWAEALLTLEEADGKVDNLGGCPAFLLGIFERADELSPEGPNEDGNAIADTEEITVAGEGPPAREGRTPNRVGRFPVLMLLLVSLAKGTLDTGGFSVLTVTSLWEVPNCCWCLAWKVVEENGPCKFFNCDLCKWQSWILGGRAVEESLI